MKDTQTPRRKRDKTLLSSITCAQLADMLEKPFDEYEPRWLDRIRDDILPQHIAILRKIPNDAPGLARSWVSVINDYVEEENRRIELEKMFNFLTTFKVKLSAVVGRPTEKLGYPKYTKELADYMASKGYKMQPSFEPSSDKYLQVLDGVAFLLEPKPKKTEE